MKLSATDSSSAQRKLCRALAFLCGLALAAPLVRGAQQAAPGAVQGIVVVEGTSDPIADVRISMGRGALNSAVDTQVLREAAGALAGRGIDPALVQAVLNGAGAAPASQFSAVTDAAGRFTIEAVPPGQYPVTALREGYFGPEANGARPTFARGSVTVSSGQNAEVRLALSLGGAISGRVLSSTGTPASNVGVTVMRRSYQDGVVELTGFSTKQTDDRGEYRLFQLPPGDYFVSAGGARPLPAPGGADGSAGGTVEQETRTFYPGVTAPANASPIALRAGEEIGGTNIRLQTERVFKISGRVISQLPAPTDLPARVATWITQRGSTASLTLMPRDPHALQDRRLTVSASMADPANGKFEIRNVPDGAYDLYASLPDPKGYGTAAPPGQATQPVAFGRTAIDVRGGDLQDVVVAVHEGVDVPGKVLVDGRGAPAPLRLTLQALDSAEGLPVYQQVGAYQPVIESDGAFRIPAVPEAAYRVQATLFLGPNASQNIAERNARTGGGQPGPIPVPLPASSYIADIRQGGATVYDDGIHVTADRVAPVEVIIRTDGAVIEGSIDGGGSLPQGITVVLVPPLSRRRNAALYKTATVTPRGTFVLNAVPPGEYKLFAWASMPASAYQNADFMKAFESRGVPVVVAGPARVSVTVALIR